MSFDFLKHAADKSKLHRAIDAIPEGATAILVVDSCLHDFGDDVEHAASECDLPIANTCDWRFMGPATTMKAMGLLDFAKHAMFENQMRGDREE